MVLSAFGGNDFPKSSVVIMQYTGHCNDTKIDSPTYAYARKMTVLPTGTQWSIE